MNLYVARERIEELEREVADLKRHNAQLRETIEALLKPPPVDDRDRLWLEHHPGEALRQKYD